MFGPDETASNRLGAVLDVTDKAWMAEILPTDEDLAPDGRVMEVLSEHQCQGWLEGYLLTGRHGLFNCYEAFIHIVDSMFNQHAKWLKVTRDLAWRRPIASLNYVLSSLVWRQDHNGFSHQDPGFIDHVVNKKADVIRVYLPPDANTLLSVADHCLRSRNYVNVIVAGKQPSPNWLSMDQAILHCTRGIGIWDWASTDQGGEPDVVIGCAGDIPTLEALAAADLLRQHLPDLKVRFVNVVDLMRLQTTGRAPARAVRLTSSTRCSPSDRPIVFAYHGYPWLIHRLTYRRTNHAQPPRPRLQGGGHDHDAVRHGDAQRPRPVPPRDRRDRPGPGPRCAGRPRPAADGRQADRGAGLHPGRGRGRAGDRRLDLAGLGRPVGPARILVVNAGSSSLKLRRPGPGGRGRRRGGPAAADGCRRRRVRRRGDRAVRAGRRRRATGWSTAAPGSPPRCVVDDAALAGIRELSAARPAPPAQVDRRHRGRRGGPAGRAERRLLRHRVPRHDPAPPPRPTRSRRRGARRWDLRRFGFHGLSHAYASRRVAELLGRAGDPGLRVVTCHLGAGSSLAAVLAAGRWTRRWGSRRSRAS